MSERCERRSIDFIYYLQIVRCFGPNFFAEVFDCSKYPNFCTLYSRNPLLPPSRLSPPPRHKRRPVRCARRRNRNSCTAVTVKEESAKIAKVGHCTVGRKYIKSTHRVLGHMFIHSLVHSQMSERCERMSKRTSELPSTT